VNVIQKNATVSTVESENPNGEFEVILSTETRDRDDENLWASEWKTPLPAKIHIDGDHGRSLDKTVGSAVPRLDGNQMVAKGTFAGTPYAQMVRQLVNEGHINSLSVTYSESKNQKGEGVQRELLNAAFVAIPANPEAVVLASKSAKAVEVGAMDAPTLAELVAKAAGGMSASGDNPQVPPKHDEMVQAVHDAACHLGAQCQNEIAADPGSADGANKSADLNLMSKDEMLEHFDLTKSSSSKDAGLPRESAEESAAAETAEKSAVSAAAEESADDTARELRARKARSLKFLTTQSALRSKHAQ
jgi:hypothetical protein